MRALLLTSHPHNPILEPTLHCVTAFRPVYLSCPLPLTLLSLSPSFTLSSLSTLSLLSTPSLSFHSNPSSPTPFLLFPLSNIRSRRPVKLMALSLNNGRHSNVDLWTWRSKGKCSTLGFKREWEERSGWRWEHSHEPADLRLLCGQGWVRGSGVRD